MVKSDLGIGFVPTDFLKQTNDIDSLVTLNINPPIPLRDICLLKRKDTSLSIAAKELEKLLLNH